MIKIRPETPADQSAIYDVNHLAFGREIEPRLVNNLRESENWVEGLSLVAEKEGEVVGHILFTKTPIETPQKDINALTLAPVAVMPNLQRQGIGSGLITEGLKACKLLGYEIVIVVGHPDYYPRFGFKQARENGLESSIEVSDEPFMVLELVPETLDGIKGMVRFPPEFSE